MEIYKYFKKTSLSKLKQSLTNLVKKKSVNSAFKKSLKNIRPDNVTTSLDALDNTLDK